MGLMATLKKSHRENLSPPALQDKREGSLGQPYACFMVVLLCFHILRVYSESWLPPCENLLSPLPSPFSPLSSPSSLWLPREEQASPATPMSHHGPETTKPDDQGLNSLKLGTKINPSSFNVCFSDAWSQQRQPD